MLKLCYLMENFELARLALTHWPHEEKNLDALLRRFRISDNAIYPFTSAGKLCFLRLAPVCEKRSGALESELALIQLLHRSGYPALEPLPAHDGSLLLTIQTPWGEWYAQAFVGVPGKPLDDLTLTEPLLLAYGESLARLHSLNGQPSPSPWRHTDALDWMEQTLTACHAPAEILAALHQVRAEMALLPQDEGQYGVIHYDFEPDNVFWDEDTQRCHVIDFADCMHHWYAADIARALDELPDDNARTIFLQGYTQARPLPENLTALLPLMRRFINLYGYTRVLRSLSHLPETQPEWMPGLIRHLQELMAQRAKALLS